MASSRLSSRFPHCSSPVEGAVLIPSPPGAPRLSHMVIVSEGNPPQWDQLTRGRSLKNFHELKASPGFAKQRPCFTSQLSTGPVVLSILITDPLSHFTSSQQLWPRSTFLSNQGHRECRKCPVAKRAPGRGPTQCESGISTSPRT